MKVAFSTARPAHVVLPANLMAERGAAVTIYTAAYRGRFRGLRPEIGLRWAPALAPSLHFLTGVELPRSLQRSDTVLFDRMVSLRMDQVELFWGWASGSLAAGRAARRRGAKFVLDRACPHVDFQQSLVRHESERLGVRYQAEPSWFRERQLAEYEEADVILVPSEYSRRSFAAELQEKIVIGPLFGRAPRMTTLAPRQDRPFTFGCVGGQPLRKGFLYLLEAWEKLRLPHARLAIRTDAELGRFPALRRLLARLPNVEIVGYVREMSEFYRRCDAFVFPTLDDGFGMALLEAMAHGLPAITTPHCGAAELFCPGEDMLMVPVQDSDALAAAMERVVRSAELREELRANAGKRLQQIESGGDFHLYADAVDRIMKRVGYQASSF